MRNLINAFQAQPLSTRVVVMVQALAIIFVMLLLGMESAQAQSGNVYSPSQAQVGGMVWEARVLQVSVKEVETNTQMRVAGGAVGGALGIALAARSNTNNRFAANTVGALLGGLIGERATAALARSQAQEIILRLDQPGQQPRNIVIVQPAPFDVVFSGESVYVTIVQGAYRVLRRDGQVML